MTFSASNSFRIIYTIGTWERGSETNRLCDLDEDERKIILFDDFGCWDEGCYMGQNTPEVLAQMPKSN